MRRLTIILSRITASAARSFYRRRRPGFILFDTGVFFPKYGAIPAAMLWHFLFDAGWNADCVTVSHVIDDDDRIEATASLQLMESEIRLNIMPHTRRSSKATYHAPAMLAQSYQLLSRDDNK